LADLRFISIVYRSKTAEWKCGGARMLSGCICLDGISKRVKTGGCYKKAFSRKGARLLSGARFDVVR
jgi:hypothetical protein